VEETTTVADDLKFGEALEELEAIVVALEGGALDLEESLARYERGVELLHACQAKLADAQQKVTMLMGELESSGGAEEAEE
jgi:exodeoxyribonuclease VII small subunit